MVLRVRVKQATGSFKIGDFTDALLIASQRQAWVVDSGDNLLCLYEGGYEIVEDISVKAKPEEPRPFGLPNLFGQELSTLHVEFK